MSESEQPTPDKKYEPVFLSQEISVQESQIIGGPADGRTIVTINLGTLDYGVTPKTALQFAKMLRNCAKEILKKEREDG